MTAAILAIDAGTTGTRAAYVTADGAVHGTQYRKLSLHAGPHGVVEQDAGSILAHTVAAAAATIAAARRAGVRIEAAALSTQRATAVLWDARTGEPFGPAISWQDTRYAHRLALYAGDWDDRLHTEVGRDVGTRSPFLWAADRLVSEPAVARCHSAGALRFGTVETWLLHNLLVGRPHMASASMAAATGGYLLREHAYASAWIEALGCPDDILPELFDDASTFGMTDPAVLGISVPVLAALGDQLAGGVGLGAVRRGQVLCVHGTGSFVDVLLGTDLGERVAAPGVTTVVTTRREGASSFAMESFTPNTGSALEWLCSGIGLFTSPSEVTALARESAGSATPLFLPALTGLRVPQAPDARGSFTGLSLGTTRADLARGVFEGLAHCVASATETAAAAATTQTTEIVVGGGLSASDPFLQAQADAAGIPVLRPHGSQAASLRGAAFVAGASGLLWPDLETAVATLGPADTFLPSLSPEDRAHRRREWAGVVEAELALAQSRQQMRKDAQ
jgi:glycerol kinase